MTPKSSEKESKRSAKIKRKTKETDIKVEIDLDNEDGTLIETDIPFFTHLLELFARHAGIHLIIKASGDLSHHTIEDVGIVLGQVMKKALGDKLGIRRYGDKTIPMDETLATCAIDLGGRAYSNIDLKLKSNSVEGLESENINHFFESLAINGMFNLHIIVQYGFNEHHKAEAAIKAFAHAFKEAIEIIDDKIPSTKGVI